MDDRRGLGARSRRRRPWWRRAGCVVLLSAALRAGGLVLLGAVAAAWESASEPPLAFAIPHPANRLTAGGAAETRRVADRLQGWFIAPRPVAQKSRKKISAA